VKQMKTWWMSYSFQGSSSFILACKLKALRAYMKKWNEVFDNVGRKRRILWMVFGSWILLHRAEF
jgi:hypothetical protein